MPAKRHKLWGRAVALGDYWLLLESGPLARCQTARRQRHAAGLWLLRLSPADHDRPTPDDYESDFPRPKEYDQR